MFQTEQEKFWAGSFGDGYIDRNRDAGLLAANLHLFGRVIARMAPIASVFEIGANVGMNLKALRQLLPHCALAGLEINRQAHAALAKVEGVEAISGSVIDFESERRFDLVFTKGVLIHINPDRLAEVYAKMTALSARYVMVCEYYNPRPVAIPYRDHQDRLFKRDFAGEIIDAHGLRLVDYGFHYHRDPQFPQDDVTWFLLEKC